MISPQSVAFQTGLKRLGIKSNALGTSFMQGSARSAPNGWNVQMVGDTEPILDTNGFFFGADEDR